MANGICVYAESYNGELETVAAELVSAAKGLAETTKEKVQAIVLSDHAEELVKELDKLGVDEIYAVKADHDITLQDDAVSGYAHKRLPVHSCGRDARDRYGGAAL